jgi:hypothetical protein
MGRLLPAYRKFNQYYEEIYADAEANRATNGCENLVRITAKVILLI